MLNTFPELLNYSILAPTLIRVVLGVVLINVGIEILKPSKRFLFAAYFSSRSYPLADLLPWKFGIAQIVLGLFFIFGFFTQIASLASLYTIFWLLYVENREEKILPHTSAFYLIMFVMALSLLLTGAGAFAVDLPL